MHCQQQFSDQIMHTDPSVSSSSNTSHVWILKRINAVYCDLLKMWHLANHIDQDFETEFSKSIFEWNLLSSLQTRCWDHVCHLSDSMTVLSKHSPVNEEFNFKSTTCDGSRINIPPWEGSSLSNPGRWQPRHSSQILIRVRIQLWSISFTNKSHASRLWPVFNILI